MKILFIGSNPSIRSQTTVAFWEDTKSTTVLHSWLKNLEGNTFSFANVSDKTTENNRALKTSEIKACLPKLVDLISESKPDKIVALGKTAEKALTLLRLDFFAMPHPSGLNRQLNDKNFVEGKIKELVHYCTSPESQTITSLEDQQHVEKP